MTSKARYLLTRFRQSLHPQGMTTSVPPRYQKHRLLHGPGNMPPPTRKRVAMSSWLQQQHSSRVFMRRLVYIFQLQLYHILPNTTQSPSVTKLVHNIRHISNIPDILAKKKKTYPIAKFDMLNYLSYVPFLSFSQAAKCITLGQLIISASDQCIIYYQSGEYNNVDTTDTPVNACL